MITISISETLRSRWHLDKSKELLRRTFDAALLIKRYGNEILWIEIDSVSRRSELRKPLVAMLEQVRAIWGVTIPAEAVEAMGNFKATARIARAHQLAMRSPLIEFIFAAKAENLRDAFLFLLSMVFPNPAFMYQRFKLEQGWQLPFFLSRSTRGWIAPKVISSFCFRQTPLLQRGSLRIQAAGRRRENRPSRERHK
jgi:hypothetical protein